MWGKRVNLGGLPFFKKKQFIGAPSLLSNIGIRRDVALSSASGGSGDWAAMGHRSSLRIFVQAEDGIRDAVVTGVQTCALPIYIRSFLFGKKIFWRKTAVQTRDQML